MTVAMKKRSPVGIVTIQVKADRIAEMNDRMLRTPAPTRDSLAGIRGAIARTRDASAGIRETLAGVREAVAR